MSYTDKLVSCPYNAAHRINPNRLAIHILKCSKSHPQIKMETCPFNATHRVPAYFYQAHIVECPDNVVVLRSVRHEITEENEDSKSSSSEDYDEDDAAMIMEAEQYASKCQLMTEDWNSPSNGGLGYNCHMASILKPFMRKVPSGLNKTARNKWYELEKQRVRELQEGVPFSPEVVKAFSIPDNVKSELADYSISRPGISVSQGEGAARDGVLTHTASLLKSASSKARTKELGATQVKLMQVRESLLRHKFKGTQNEEQPKVNQQEQQLKVTEQKHQRKANQQEEQVEAQQEQQLKVSPQKKQLKASHQEQQLKVNPLKPQLDVSKQKHQLKISQLKEQLKTSLQKHQLEGAQKGHQQNVLQKQQTHQLKDVQLQAQIEVTPQRHQLKGAQKERKLDITQPKQQLQGSSDASYNDDRSCGKNVDGQQPNVESITGDLCQHNESKSGYFVVEAQTALEMRLFLQSQSKALPEQEKLFNDMQAIVLNYQKLLSENVKLRGLTKKDGRKTE
ncbi:golgin subfamily A member 6-like protein 7 [Hyalella azteca]|uniref:Golgin subfamily A member 6-like protein 7 n=1 Tax=Hyalella azteca TaxID=294128 RepID=A0A8B7PAW6_HYAAZ|nr:golgin subfamily A member 6-like protein 7 [Hyalella azteca]